MRTHPSLSTLCDNDLVRGLERLCGAEREAMGAVLWHLVEVERRQLYLERGYGSLYDFCTGHLEYSRSAAGRRITAARCLGRYPRVAGMLQRGSINLCTLSLVAGMLTPENHRAVLTRITGMAYRDVQWLVARHNPQGAVRDRVRPI
jgi:hypothetical protein